MIGSGLARRAEAMNMNQIREYVITKITAARDSEPSGEFLLLAEGHRLSTFTNQLSSTPRRKDCGHCLSQVQQPFQKVVSAMYNEAL